MVGTNFWEIYKVIVILLRMFKGKKTFKGCPKYFFLINEQTFMPKEIYQ